MGQHGLLLVVYTKKMFTPEYMYKFPPLRIPPPLPPRFLFGPLPICIALIDLRRILLPLEWLATK